MRIIKAALAFLLFIAVSSHAETQYSKRITFDKLEYFYAYEGVNDSDDVFVVEYLPQGETLERFNQMITYSELRSVKAEDLKKYVETMSQDTTAPIFSKTYYRSQDSSKNEYYLVRMGVQGSLAEYMVFRFMVKDDHIAYYLYSDRSYEGLNDHWMSIIKDRNSYWLTAIRALKI